MRPPSHLRYSVSVSFIASEMKHRLILDVLLSTTGIKMVITLSRRRILPPCEERKEDNLNRKELIRLVAKDNSLTLGDSEFCINAVCNAISKVVNDGDKLSIYGFGTFQKVRRKPKPYRHPVTGEMCVPEPSDVIKFVPGVAFFPSTEPDYADL